MTVILVLAAFGARSIMLYDNVPQDPFSTVSEHIDKTYSNDYALLYLYCVGTNGFSRGKAFSQESLFCFSWSSNFWMQEPYYFIKDSVTAFLPFSCF